LDAKPEARFEIRHGTQDQEVFNQVVVENQYQLADSLPEHALIVDIGANIGAFAVACLLRGAGGVICFEPSPENFQQLANNLAPWPGKAACFNSGVWRSDLEEPISFSAGHGTAAGCCFPSKLVAGAPRTNSIGLDEIILQCTDNGSTRIQLLKIDAEYSEYPILYTAKRLHLVDEIIGEAHEFHEGCVSPDLVYRHPSYQSNAADLARFLVDQGFRVELKTESYTNQINSLFFATRPAPEQK
jgi:FkbM family methyltransferase